MGRPGRTVAPESAMTSSTEAMGLQMVPICNENDNYVQLLLGAGKKMICDIPASTLASAPSQLWPSESLEAKGAKRQFKAAPLRKV